MNNSQEREAVLEVPREGSDAIFEAIRKARDSGCSIRNLWDDIVRAALKTTPTPAETSRERLTKQVGSAIANRANLPDPLITPTPAVGMSACNKCGAEYPSAPAGTVHKCGRCSGGYCSPRTPAPAVSTEEIVGALEEATDAIDQLERAVRFLTPENVRPDTSNARALVERSRATLSRIRGEG